MLFQSTHPCGVRLRYPHDPLAPIQVSIHAPVWGATQSRSRAAGGVSFNPRTRVGCDVQFNTINGNFTFQSTHPCGVRRALVHGVRVSIWVSIHAPVWGATTLLICLRPSGTFQSTHPCGVRPWAGISLTNSLVSIHAPVWGATNPNRDGHTLPPVSIHAPVWGATAAQTPMTHTHGFQSTHPCGVRRKQRGRGLKWLGFNPRTRVGCDYGGFLSIVSGEFQSTHPCGVRLNGGFCLGNRCSFNPRTRVGCDLEQASKTVTGDVSIHAPVWGATMLTNSLSGVLRFNPRTRVGCDLLYQP